MYTEHNNCAEVNLFMSHCLESNTHTLPTPQTPQLCETLLPVSGSTSKSSNLCGKQAHVCSHVFAQLEVGEDLMEESEPDDEQTNDLKQKAESFITFKLLQTQQLNN